MTPRVLFINPRYCGNDGLVILPLDQASAVGYALAQDCNVEVLDLAFASDDESLRRELLEQSYDLVVITCITVCFSTAVTAARLVKDLYPELPVALMGEHVTFRRRETLVRHSCFDFVMSYEAESTVVRLARALSVRQRGEDVDLPGIPGITFRRRGRPGGAQGDSDIVVNPDQPPIQELDTLPLPAKHRYALDHYLRRDHETTMITTRGCTNQCTFCYRWRYGRRLRCFSVERVLREIEYNLSLGFSAIFFQDDVFCHDKQRTRILCRRLIDHGLRFEWNCNVRLDDFDPDDRDHGELASLMKHAGCYRVFVGIEAFDQELLDGSNKQTRAGRVQEVVRFWQTRGIQVHASYIIGLPGDTRAKIQRRVDLARELNTDLASFNRIFPHPGTPFGDHPERYGLVVPDRYWYEKTDWWSRAVAGNSELSPAQIYEVQQWAISHYTEEFPTVISGRRTGESQEATP